MKTVNSLLITVVAISFMACGGSNNNQAKGFDENSYEQINISKSCTTPDTIEDYITLKSGDRIVKDDEGTKVSILHDENSVKKICLNSGKAHIVRAFEQ